MGERKLKSNINNRKRKKDKHGKRVVEGPNLIFFIGVDLYIVRPLITG